MKPKILILISMFFMTAVSVQAQSKIGYINSLELLSYMPDIRRADSTLKLMADEMQKQYGFYVQEYQTKLDDYNTNVPTWSPEKKEATETDLLSMQERIANYEQSSQQKIEKKKQELYDPLVTRANEAIQAVGKEQNLICVIDASTGALIYAGEEMVNILPLVKQKLNIPQ
ncbi:MAG: OmpH family outer membrane protein [Chitinophagales bacterium]|nr:OmpH family outer membrane protein [Chitinophagales bacterium]